MRLRDRLEMLEQRDAPSVTRWHWIIGEPGETREDAQVRYERDQRPIGASEGLIFWNQFTDNGKVPQCG